MVTTMNFDISDRADYLIGKAQGHHSHEVNTLFAFADFEPADNCVNPDSYGMICVKCGQCGRKFGVEVDEE